MLIVQVAPILVGVFLSAMDNTIVVSCMFYPVFDTMMLCPYNLSRLAFGKIGTYFNEMKKTSWIATAYLLTVASFQFAVHLMFYSSTHQISGHYTGNSAISSAEKIVFCLHTVCMRSDVYCLRLHRA
jgi:hypothetical protein